MIKFIHTADLHLGTPFKGESFKDRNIRDKLVKSTYFAFDNLINLCIDENVDFLLIAGDVFESATEKFRSQLNFREGLKKLDENGIRTFIVCGNHDPAEFWLPEKEWPQNVHIFPTDKVSTEAASTKSGDRVFIHGISYKIRDEFNNLSLQYKRTGEPDAFEIGLLHCNVGSNQEHDNYAPCKKNDLLDIGMDYWALGHIHKREILSEDPYIVYPGNIQGRHINEPGEKGCYLVNVDNNRNTSCEFKRLDAISWESFEIDISEAESTIDIDNLFEDKCKDLLKSSAGIAFCGRLKLKGRNQLIFDLDREQGIDEYFESLQKKGLDYELGIYITEVLSEVKPEHDTESLLNQPDFLGDLLQAGKELREKPDLKEALDEVFKEIEQVRELKNIVEEIDQDTLAQILKEAEYMSIDRLQE